MFNLWEDIRYISSKISEINLLPSPMYLFWKYAVYCEAIRDGSTVFSFAAKAFENLFRSVFNKTSSNKILISSFVFDWSQISFQITSYFVTNTFTDLFIFEIKKKFSWFFTFFIPLTFASSFNTLIYFLINKLKVVFTFCIFINISLRV